MARAPLPVAAKQEEPREARLRSLFGNLPYFASRTFISYRTRQHREQVEAIASILEGAGWEIWYDRRFSIPPHMALGLDYFIKRGLTHSDALLYIEPSPLEEARSFLQRMRDGAEFYSWMLVAGCGFAPGVWYGLVYSALLKKRILRPTLSIFFGKPGSWQEHELSVGQELGIRIIRIVLSDDPDSAPAVDETRVVIRPAHLDEDVRAAVVPRLELAHRAAARHKREMWKVVRLSLLSIGFAAGVLCTVAAGVVIGIVAVLLYWLVGLLS